MKLEGLAAVINRLTLCAMRSAPALCAWAREKRKLNLAEAACPEHSRRDSYINILPQKTKNEIIPALTIGNKKGMA